MTPPPASARLLDGRAFLAEAKEVLAGRAAAVARHRGSPPGLATVLVGDDPGSHTYVRLKHEDCAEIGVRSKRCDLPADASLDSVITTVAACNADPAVDGIIVQLPLPRHLDTRAVVAALDPDKDADGLHPVSMGHLLLGDPTVVPCAPAAVQGLLARNRIPVAGRHVVVVGAGATVGRPLSVLLSQPGPHASAVVTVLHEHVDDLAAYTRQADIVIGAAPRASLVTPDMVRPGVVAVSVGTERIDGRAMPDIDEAVAEVASWVTPRLGGIGPATRATLLANVVGLAERHCGLARPDAPPPSPFSE